jgi:hypothetical protein
MVGGRRPRVVSGCKKCGGGWHKCGGGLFECVSLQPGSLLAAELLRELPAGWMHSSAIGALHMNSTTTAACACPAAPSLPYVCTAGPSLRCGMRSSTLK